VRTVAILLVVAAGIAAVLFAVGVFDPAEPTDVRVPEPESPDGPAELRGAPPTTMPPLETFRLADPVTVLLLVEYPQTVNRFLAQQWAADRKVRVLAWGSPPPAAPDRPGVPPMTAMEPDAKLLADLSPALLESEAVDVVVVHDLDPARVPAAFWEAVGARVREGKTGLLVYPSVRTARAMVGHEVLGPLLPVRAFLEPSLGFEPGAFERLAPFAVTEAGAKHPATRLVGWETWSRTWWEGRRTATQPWGTLYVAPVSEVQDGASVLLEVVAPRGAPIPAVVAAPPSDGRVLWIGHWDLGDKKGYGKPDTVRDWNHYLMAWLAWLAGRAE
jgi:hypothetical protein